MKTNSLMAKNVQLIENEDTTEDIREIFAAINKNENVTWIKFILTDSKPNGNGDIIPKEEFANVIKTGMFMPVKLSERVANRLNLNRHYKSKPVGVITHLLDKGDHVEAMAALWAKERPEDIQFLRERFAEGDSVDVSWEVTYDHEEAEETNEGLILRNVRMNAATIVDFPAYEGRTPIVALASLSEKSQGILNGIFNRISEGVALSELDYRMLSRVVESVDDDELDSSLLKLANESPLTAKEAEMVFDAVKQAVPTIDDIETILKGENNQMDTISRKDHEEIVSGLKSDLQEKDEALNEANATIETLKEAKSELDEAQAELKTLKEFKEEVEKEKEQTERLASIRQRFEEAEIEVSDEYMEAKAETLLSMNDEALDFFIQEMVAFNERVAEQNNKNKEDEEKNEDKKETMASLTLGSKVPDLRANGDLEKDDFISFLQELDE